MGIVSFLKLGLKCFFDFLAWPLFALVCPLYASVWAIESNSNSDMRNLVAYWIVFSLISLFELAFVKLIEWLPFWPYMKLMAICWLGLPHFNGACYVYECLIRPCLSANPQGVINQFVKHKEDVPLNAESFLAMAEMYVKENGSEALEKLIDRKSNHTMPNIDVEEIKAVTNTVAKEMVETKEMAAAIQEPNVANEDAKTVEPKEKIPAASTQWSKFKEFAVAKENAKAEELNEKNSTTATEQVKCVEEPILSQTEKRTVTSIKIEEKTTHNTTLSSSLQEHTKMALQLSLQFPILPKTSPYPQIKLTHKPITITRTTKRNITQFTIKATTTDEENNNNNVSEPQIVSTQQSTPNEQQPQPTNSSTSDLSDLGSEIKKAMKERDGDADGGGYLWSGVAEEIREIEWPAFGKVVGTTGVVLGVIAGSSVVLLTVNAVLAELSDRVFAGKGLQDFFG